MANERPHGSRLDEATNTHTVGHEWDGIEELDTPMPRWWLWTFYITIVFAIGYCIAYPAIPLINKGTEGVLGWTSRGKLAGETQAAEAKLAPVLSAIGAASSEDIARDPELLRQAIAGGHAAFKVNCVQCHGAGAAGFKGYPNLNDDDWLWGGDLAAIEYTLIHGIRQPDHKETRFSQMPAFGRDGILSSAEVAQVADHVLSLSGKAKATAAGAELFANNCAVCHGPQGLGDRTQGAPNLADAIWLYGGSREDVIASIHNSRYGVMPAWGERLDPVTIRMLAIYVHSLGGGEDFTEVARQGENAPAKEADEQP